MPITLSLSGKVALITGGSRGIGAAAVRMFVAAGARVMFNYEKSKSQSERLVKALGKKNCAAIHCNLSGTGTAQELVEATVKRFGRLDILVANHGVWPPEDAPIEKMSDARSEEHTSELQSRENLVCRLLLEKKKTGDLLVATGIAGEPHLLARNGCSPLHPFCQLQAV